MGMAHVMAGVDARQRRWLEPDESDRASVFRHPGKNGGGCTLNQLVHNGCIGQDGRDSALGL